MTCRLATTLFATTTLVLTTASCSLLFESPTVRITGAQLFGVSLTGATVEVELEVQNPNRYGLTAAGLEYRLEVEDAGIGTAGRPSGGSEAQPGEDAAWTLLAEGTSDVEVSVPAGGSARVPITVPFRYEDVGRAFLGLIQTGDLRYRFSGEVRFDAPVGSVGVPFEDMGRVGDG